MCYFKISELFDWIDVLLKRRQEKEHFKICLQCNSKASVTLRTCKVWKGKLARLEVSIEKSQQEKVNPYSHFKVKEKSNVFKVMLGELHMLNPNSFENLSVFLRSLGQRAKISQCSPLISEAESRRWVFIENDGAILNPVLKLILNVYQCLDYNEAIYGQANFESHLCNGAVHGNKNFKFDWIVPQIRLLHFKMNAAKSFINFCWEPCMKEVCLHLGFVSENTQMQVKKGSEHHKLWNLLKIGYITLTDE